jgi:polyphosphate kinase 2 (PPK2 family)
VASSAKSREALGNKEYAKELKKLHVELVKLQQWVQHKGSRSASYSKAATAPGRVARSRRLPSA